MNIFSIFRADLKTKRSGFTLIELLIVMVIIAVLATLGFVSYSNALTNTRNAKGISDMKALQAALEQEYTNNGGRYTTAAGNGVCDYTLETPLSGAEATSGLDYTGPFCTDSTYCACAEFTGASSSKGNRTGDATTANCGSFASSGTLFCIQQRQ